jgi:hypothetical protein
MRLLMIPVVATLVATDAFAQADLRPQPSGRATTEVVLADPRVQDPTVTPLSIKIDYGVPHLRGRTLHTADLVPYDVPWRTGANAATTLTTPVDLMIGGTAVPKGAYVVLTLPSRTGWKLILQKSGQAPGVPAADFARIDLRQTTLTQPLESLTIWLIPATATDAARGELRLAWGTVQLSTDWVVNAGR